MSQSDHFARQAAAYSRFRPRYPHELFSFVAGQLPECGTAWDCGCGSGQASGDLARHFRRVVATDPSLDQLARAPQYPRVSWVAAAAEAAPLADDCIDAACVFQAQHWFDNDRFYDEVERVVRPGGLLVVAAYGLLRISKEIDPILDDFYSRTVGPWWPQERRHLDSAYREIPFPFPRIRTPRFSMTAEWGLGHLLGYLRSWSAVQRCLDATGRDPVVGLEPRLGAVWEGPGRQRGVCWPLLLRVGRIGSGR